MVTPSSGLPRPVRAGNGNRARARTTPGTNPGPTVDTHPLTHVLTTIKPTARYAP